MTSTFGRLLALADLPRGRLVLALGLGALALGFGVALPATAGYLISRAAEQPPILSLTTIVVVVRFLALARPLTRYLDRLASHDLALRTIGPLRARVYERIEPLAPAELGAFRRGDLLTRMVGDVDALQGLSIRGHRPAGRRARRRRCLRRRDGVAAAGRSASCSPPASWWEASRCRSSQRGWPSGRPAARRRRAAS